MVSTVPFLLFVCYLAFYSIIGSAQDRPHGLPYESPMAFPPSAFSFFNPSADGGHSRGNGSPLPVAAQFIATEAHESKEEEKGTSGNRMGASGIAGIAFGSVFVVISAMGVFYVLAKRRNGVNRATSVQTDA